MENEPKHCPFCGGEAEETVKDYGNKPFLEIWYECKECGCRTAKHNSFSEAKAAWNNRTDGWISHRLPTEDDADENGNVLVWNGKCSVLAYYKAAICRGNSWQPLPSAPKGE